MTIRNRLYIGFGALLFIVLALWITNMLLFQHDSLTADKVQKAVDSSNSIEKLRSQMMQERVSLSNYLLSGSQSDFSEIEKNRTLFKRLLDDAKSKAVSDSQRPALSSVATTTQPTYASSPKPLTQ